MADKPPEWWDKYISIHGTVYSSQGSPRPSRRFSAPIVGPTTAGGSRGSSCRPTASRCSCPCAGAHGADWRGRHVLPLPRRSGRGVSPALGPSLHGVQDERRRSAAPRDVDAYVDYDPDYASSFFRAGLARTRAASALTGRATMTTTTTTRRERWARPEGGRSQPWRKRWTWTLKDGKDEKKMPEEYQEEAEAEFDEWLTNATKTPGTDSQRKNVSAGKREAPGDCDQALEAAPAAQ